MGHIPTKPRQFLISSFQDFLRTDAQTLSKTILDCSIAGAQVINLSTEPEEDHTQLGKTASRHGRGYRL